MDLSHGLPFIKPTKIYAGDYSDCKGSDIIIITAGANQKPDQTRTDLIAQNAAIFKSIVSGLSKFCDNAIILVVTNPVDILSYITYKLMGLPKNMVIGSGTVLDTARLKYLIAQHVNIDVRDVNAYIIGEHGDTEVAVWSMANIAGIPIKDYCVKCSGCSDSVSMQEIYQTVKNSAYEIIKKKGATYYAIALAVKKIAESIIRDENSILTISSLLESQHGISDVFLSLPTIVNKTGAGKILDISLDESESRLLSQSADSLKALLSSIGL